MSKVRQLRDYLRRSLREADAAIKYASGMEIFARHRPIMQFLGVKPFKTNDTFIAPSASVIGNVTTWDESSVWYGAVVRGDSHPISIGFSSNIQDRVVLNTLSVKVKRLESGFRPVCYVGHYVSVGSGSVLVSCRIDDLVKIGERSTILEGAIVQSNVILDPGTVVTPYACIPSGQRWGGNPARFVDNLNDEERDNIKSHAEKVHLAAREHIVEFLPVGNTYIHLEELEAEYIKVVPKEKEEYKTK